MITEIKAFCLKCSKEEELIVETKIKTSGEIKYIGTCSVCGDYLCLVCCKSE